MQTNRLNLRNTVTIVICLAAMTTLVSCEKEDDQVEKSLVGRWVTSDYHAGDSDLLVFTEDFYVQEYFSYIFANQVIPAMYTAPYVTYSLSGNNITFTLHYSYPAEKIDETFKYILNKNSLTIKGFSNPFSITEELRHDVCFTRTE